ncbi:unnamed protein product [Blepharisma stoltei]|uniref:Uncharacterized protein n=1 Tax=Blepharisma stoltei TaxID=1481888 RepID=A0AAU9J5H8_9CILI|nr:unnamed protein product [Blepharisma stoltei]
MGCGIPKHKGLLENSMTLKNYSARTNHFQELSSHIKDLMLKKKRKRYIIRVFTPDTIGLNDDSIALPLSKSR